MASLRRGVIQRIGIACTAVLILLPLALSGHRHQAAQPSASHACTLCVATHYSPATTTAPLPQLPSPIVAVATMAQDVTPVARFCPPSPSGRAPPLSLPFHAV
jgi:hypothetical protein